MADPIRSKLNSILTETEILSERLDIQKTIEKQGANIQRRMKEDDSIRNNETVEDFVTEVMKVDPTPNQKYGLWIINMYLSGAIKRFEDLPRVTEPLMVFHKFKQRMQIKDINQIKTLNQLYDLTEPFEDQKSNKEVKRGYRDELITKGEAEILLNNNKWRVIVPKTEAASCEFGKNTKWCTAANRNNQFNSYNNNGKKIYIIEDKPNNRRYQFSFDDEQFTDERDNPINLYDFFNQNKDVLNSVKDFNEQFKFYKHDDGQDGYMLKIPVKN